MVTELDILIRTRELIAAGWTQGCNARDEQGYQVPFFDPMACQFCLSGGLLVAYTELDPTQRCDNGPITIFKTIEDVLDNDITIWNDASERTKEDVLNLIDALIANRRQLP